MQIETEPGDALTLGDIMDIFPLEGPICGVAWISLIVVSGSFHFRFKFGSQDGHCWIDVNDPDATGVLLTLHNLTLMLVILHNLTTN